MADTQHRTIAYSPCRRTPRHDGPAAANQHWQLHVPCNARVASVPGALVGAVSYRLPGHVVGRRNVGYVSSQVHSWASPPRTMAKARSGFRMHESGLCVPRRDSRTPESPVTLHDENSTRKMPNRVARGFSPPAPTTIQHAVPPLPLVSICVSDINP
jgi:hypothetical protein